MAVRTKIRQPTMHGDDLPRHRITSMLVDALRDENLLAVVASAGSGKTTAVAQALDSYPTPVAWVELDERDQAAGRLLTYLQDAIRHAINDLPDVVGPALAATDSQPEAAGSLAESLDHDGLVIVLDNVEQVLDSPTAIDVLASFIRFVRRSTRIVLISRDKLPDSLRRYFVGGRGTVIGDAELAVTADEAEELLGKWGRSGVDALSAVEATNGWIMGLRLESWRLPGHVYGVGGESDALSGYLAVEIFASLTPDERDLLVRTSVLDEVTLVKAETLGCTNASAAFARVSGRPMPMTTFNSGMSVRYHPRFRQYLQSQFQLLPLEQQRRVLSAYGRMLVAEQRHEDAVEPLLRAGEVGEAALAAAHAAPSVLDRLDFELVESWLAALGPPLVRANADLLAADVRVACELEQYDRGAESADRLLEMHAEHRGTHVTSALAVAAAWCFFLVSRIDDARRFLAIGPNTADCRLMAFLIGVELIDDPTHYSERPPACGGVVDGLLARADIAHGRFREVLAEEVKPWASVRSSRVAAMRYLGMTEQAASSVQHLELGNWPRVRIYADIMVDCGRPQEAWAALLQGRELRARTGSNLYRMFELLDEAAIALRFNNDVSFALAALREVEHEPTADRRIRIIEQVHLWKGLAALIQDDAEQSAGELRRAVEVMVRWDRLLWLPTAAVYLAEAEWRLDNLDAADVAADLALASAERQGSRHLLIEALREFPAVVSRRLDAETDLDSAWHELGRHVLSPSVPGWEVARPRVTVLEMGTQALLVDGQVIQPKLSKSVELLSFLAAHGRRVSRAVVQEALFVGSSEDADGAYLRLAVNGLRKVLPADVPLRMEDGIIAWEGEGLASESAQIETSVTRLSHLPAGERRAAAYQQLAVLAKGPYLPSCKSEWAERRRDRIALMALDVKEVLSDLAYQAGDYREADALVWQVLDDAPHRERSWRLAMRIASAMGADDRVLEIFRQCADAMADLGTEPSAATRQVAAKLRGVTLRT